MRSIFVVAVLCALPLVAAHGYVDSITIDGERYEGNSPGRTDVDSPIRTISTIDPVKGATNRAINCGPNAEPAALVADAKPGSSIDVSWSNGNWPHSTGPILNYLASCSDTTCDQFDAINAQWFKIDQAGKKPGSSEWFQNDIKDGQQYSFTLPDNLPSGQYLLRHELIGLHLAENEGGAEFYPACIQINVGGNGTGTVSADELVSFPGAYSDTDPGILVDAFNSDTYNFPGPAIATLVSSGGSGGGSSDDSSSSSFLSGPVETASPGSIKPSSDAGPTRTRAVVSSETSTPDDTSPAAGATSTTGKRKPCSVTKRSPTFKRRSVSGKVGSRPHRVSRIMRDLLNHHS